MIEIPGPIPVGIHPFFWLFAALIGWLMSKTLTGMFIWLGIIFVSVLFHEFGHAITAVCFRQKARIQLVALGGVTSYEGPKLKFWKQFLITFNGPLFGFLLSLIATALLLISWPPLFTSVLKATQIANIFWTVVNLLPVLPMDGGQLLRIVLEANFGIKGFKASLLIGSAIAVAIALVCFLFQNMLLGAFFFLFAFMSFDSWRKSRFATGGDREESNREMIVKGEIALQEGKKEEARQIFEQVLEKTSKGMLADTAAQYLAFLDFKDGKRQEAYDLLLPIKDHLSEDSLCLLHELAAEQKNYPIVAELSTSCYQYAPSQKSALSNARAFAALKKSEPAGGWLQTASQYGGLHLESILSEDEFRELQNDSIFKKYVDDLK